MISPPKILVGTAGWSHNRWEGAGLQLEYLLTGKTVDPPDSLLRQFPQLREIVGLMQEEAKDLSA
jgi:hypothetical protein